jgi:hypothetical protein
MSRAGRILRATALTVAMLVPLVLATLNASGIV